MDFDFTTETITPDNSGTLTIDGHVDILGQLSPSVASIAAAGVKPSEATPITKTTNIVSASGAGMGVLLPSDIPVTAGTTVNIINTSIYAINVYPPTGGSINGQSNNDSWVITAGDGMSFSTPVAYGAAWYTHGSTLVAGNNISLTHTQGKITIAGAAGGGGGSQSTISVNQAAHGFTKGIVVFFFEGVWYRVLGTLQAHTTPGIVIEVINSDSFRVQTADVISSADLPGGLVGRTRYYPSSTGALVAENNLTGSVRLDAAAGKLLPVLYTFSTEYTGGVVNPSPLTALPQFNFVELYEPTKSATALLWYRDGTTDNYELASASSESTLATHITALPPDSTEDTALGISLYNVPTELEYMFSLGISNQLEDLILAGSEGAKVYLSTIPGQVTLTPPAIRQVVGVLNADGKVLWHVPYREVPNITVSTTAPSSPVIGDIWVDIS